MAVTKIVFFQFLILATVHLLLAENDEGGLFGLPSGKAGPGSAGPNGESGDREAEDRFFHSPGLTFSACNYTATPGRSCLSCNQTQTCLQSNLGIVKSCHGRMRFCNNGSCSRNPSAACNGTANSTTSG